MSDKMVVVALGQKKQEGKTALRDSVGQSPVRVWDVISQDEMVMDTCSSLKSIFTCSQVCLFVFLHSCTDDLNTNNITHTPTCPHLLCKSMSIRYCARFFGKHFLKGIKSHNVSALIFVRSMNNHAVTESRDEEQS